MELKFVYEPLLRRSVDPVDLFDQELKDQAEAMLELVKKNNGLGLSANQVGLNKRLIVLGYQPIDDKDEIPAIPFQALANPQVVKFSHEKTIMLEGCLSFPGLEIPVERSLGVTVMAQDLQGKAIKIKAKGLYARVLQHEIDHLNGVLFTDYLTKTKAKVVGLDFCKTLFFGSDEFSYEILRALIDRKLPIIGVITETSKPSGRGQTIEDPFLKKKISRSVAPIFQPSDKDEIIKLVSRLKPNLIVLASYGKILPASALETAPFGGLNVHPSLLPKYRGATPLETAIINGESETGVTIQRMSPQVDQGAIVASEPVTIDRDDDFLSLRQKSARIGAELLVDRLPSYLLGQIKLVEQDDRQMTMTKKITKDMALIDWSRSASEICNLIRAYRDWPIGYTFLGGRRLQIHSAKVVDNLLFPLIVQLESKKACSWSDFCRGHRRQLTEEIWYDKIYQDAGN